MKTLILTLFFALLGTRILGQFCELEILLGSQAEVDSFVFNYSIDTLETPGITISGPDITNLNGLSSINSIEYLCIEGNPTLTSLSGLEGLTNVGNLSILNNSALTDLSGLEGLANIEYLAISSNSALTSLTGLEGVSTVGQLAISSNPALASLSGLDSLTRISYQVGSYQGAAFLEISDNPALTSLSGLNALRFVTGNYGLGEIRIVNNDALSSLSGLNALVGVGVSEFRISNNDALTSLSGLEQAGLGCEELFITNNPSLSLCANSSICHFLNNPFNWMAFIHNNAPGCNTNQEVQQACLTGLDESAPSLVQVFPNPVRDRLTIILPATFSTAVAIYDVFGRLMYEEQEAKGAVSIDFSSFPPGPYHLRIGTGITVEVRRIVKN